MPTRSPITAALLAAALAGCGGGSSGSSNPSTPPPTAPPPGGVTTVRATSGLAFVPANVAIAVGDTVEFAFGPVAHNVFFDAGTGAPADIPGANANVSVKRAFARRGTFRYSCHIHPFMAGTVNVGGTTSVQ
jgi:plastocyanin